MNEQKFWEVIQVAHDQSHGDMDSKCETVKASIRKLSSDDATTFSNIFDEMMDRAYTWSLWGAAYVINGGCGDDSFTDFRSSLISRGKKSFENAIADPDSLSNETFDEDEWYFEGFQYAVTEGIESAVGSTPPRSKPHPEEPYGEAWKEDTEALKAKYPNLWVCFEHIWAPSKPSNLQIKKPWWKFW